jgi:hypothetical protein
VVETALAALTGKGHETAIIGRVDEGNGVEDEDGEAFPWPERDEVARLLSSEEVQGDDATI